MLPFNEYNNTVILPVIKNDGHHFIGGVYCNKKYINEGHLYTPAPYIDPIVKIDKKVIFGGILFNHYGHFLLESLSRIWYIKEHQDIPICWTFLSGHAPLMSKWQKEIFDILNIKNEIFFLEKPIQFSSVIVPFPGYIHGKSFISNCYTNAVGVYENPKKTIDKLYISRTKMSSNCGGFDNEQELENLLKKRDWEIFHPQEYSVKEQLFKISSAKIIFGIESSALHTLVLMKNISTKFFTFSKAENTIGTYNIIAKIKNIDYTTLNINKKIKKRSLYAPLNRYDVDMLQLKELLEQSKDFSCCNNIENYKIKNSYKIISYPEAKDIMEKSNSPTCEEESYYRSILYKNDNRLHESKNVIQKFVNNENASCSLLSHYCRILIELGDINDILKITNKILKRQMHWVQTFPITLSSLCFKKGYYDLAEKLIFLTLEEYPNSALANHKLSLIYGKKKQFNKALEYARKAFKLNERDINLATSLSNFLRWTKRYEEATSFIKKMIVEKPNWTEAYRQLSYMERDFGNIQEAISLAKKAIELSPDKLNYNEYLCILLCKKKDFRAALEVAQKVLVHDSNQAWVYNQLANIYYEIGKLEKALVNIQKAIEIDKNNKSYKSFYHKIKYKKNSDITFQQELSRKKENKMCSGACIKFVEDNLSEADIKGKDVIEVGSRFVNGTVRWAIEQHGPQSYMGIDIFDGPNVDRVCSIEDTFNQFEADSFDIVVSTELLEHVIDFRMAINALKRLCRKDGIIVLTTRSKGFGLHGYPYDFWRYEKEDMEKIFSDFQIVKCIDDSSTSPGVFLIAKNVNNGNFVDLTSFQLYNILYDCVMSCDTELLEKKVLEKFTLKNEEDKSFFIDNTTLYDYGARRNTDKTVHNYLNKYEFFLKKFRDESFDLIELGVFKGSSIMMWHDYFKKAKIIGVDKNNKCLNLKKDRIDIQILDLGNIDSYKILYKYSPLIIIDDASHLWDHQLLSFFELFKILKRGGIYILEDLQTSFDPLKPKYMNNMDISPYEILSKISEAVVSNNSKDRIINNYSLYVNTIAKSIEMITFIKGSCIIIKK